MTSGSCRAWGPLVIWGWRCRAGYQLDRWAGTPEPSYFRSIGRIYEHGSPRRALLGFDAFSSANRLPPTDQVRGHASLENAMTNPWPRSRTPRRRIPRYRATIAAIAGRRPRAVRGRGRSRIAARPAASDDRPPH